MKKDWLKDWYWIILVIIVVGLSCLYAWGYRNGVKSVKTETIETIKYVKGEEVRDTVYCPKPYKEFVHDTITFETYKETDTSRLYEIWCDYHKKRSYELDFSNDTLGTFKVDVDIMKNSLANARSTIQPITRIETKKEVIYKHNTVRGYVSLGSSIDFSTNQVQGGVELFDKYLIGASGIRNNNNVYYTINVGIKF